MRIAIAVLRAWMHTSPVGRRNFVPSLALRALVHALGREIHLTRGRAHRRSERSRAYDHSMIRTTSKRLAPLAVIAVCALTIGGCADSESATTVASSALATNSASADEDALPKDTSPKESPSSDDAALTVTDIRVGEHEGFNRVVYELGGTGTPGWHVEYVDVAAQDGSGRPVEVGGQAILEVRITGSTYPFDSEVQPYSGPDPVPGIPGGVVTDVNGALVFEGVTQSFIGVSEQGRPFSVSALTNPTRLVIDIAT